MSTTDKMIRTSHGSISVRDSGCNGMPVVLIHGPSCSKDVFVHQFDGSLAHEFRLLAIDLPGHGASSDAICPEETYSISGYADAVIEVLEFHGIDQAVVVGSSLGGQIGLEMMASFPGIAGVLLAGAAPLGKDAGSPVDGLRATAEIALLAQRHLDGEQAARLKEMLAADDADLQVAASIARADGRARVMLMADIEAGNFTDGRELVETSMAPIAVINGACDRIVDHASVERLPAEKLWDQTCRVLPNVGHMPFVEVPEIFNHLLKLFVRDAQRQAAANENTFGICLSA